MNPNSKKGPEGPFHRPGGPMHLKPIVPGGPIGCVVRVVVLPVEDGEILPGRFTDPEFCRLLPGKNIRLEAPGGEWMSWETAFMVFGALEECAWAEAVGDWGVRG